MNIVAAILNILFVSTSLHLHLLYFRTHHEVTDKFQLVLGFFLISEETLELMRDYVVLRDLKVHSEQSRGSTGRMLVQLGAGLIWKFEDTLTFLSKQSFKFQKQLTLLSNNSSSLFHC